MTPRLRGRRARSGDSGASVVEFALLAPVLFMVLFGIIDYGIWFSDSISARQAVRDGARRGVVEDFGACSPKAGGSDGDLHNLACTIRAGMEPISGTTYVKVSIATDPASGSGTSTWTAGATLRVCAMSQHTALLPLVPFPADGISRTRVDMPIEQATTATRTGWTGPAPAGADWTWCP